MNAALSRQVVRQRQRSLLEWRRQGRSVRWIARQLNVAPKTAQRRLQELQTLSCRAEPASPIELGPIELGLDDSPPGFDPANLRRCRSCGALVYLWPCLACALQEANPEPTTKGVTCHAHS